jgi:hypothetical protein
MEESVEKYRINLEGPGFSHQEDVSREAFDEIHQLLVKLRIHGVNPKVEGVTATNDESQQPSPARFNTSAIRRFIGEHNAQRNPDKLVALVYFLQEATGQNEVTREFLRYVFNLAGFNSENYGRDMRWACRVNWLKELEGQERLLEGKKKIQTLSLTESGKAAVEAKFDEETLRKSRQPRQTKDKREKEEGGNL